MQIINRITVKKDGVYISARDPEEPRAFRSRLSEKLTKAYREGGQRGLDQKIFDLEDSMQIELRGDHPSIRRYKDTLHSSEAKEIFEEYRLKIEELNKDMSDKDMRDYWFGPQTPKTIAYFNKHWEHKQTLYQQLAEICPPVKQRTRNAVEKKR